MIRMSIKYIPANKQIQDKNCASGSYDSSIKSLIPSILPDETIAHKEGEIINFEYSHLNSESPKYKINPYKPEQNRVKFTIKKPSTFRFEAIAYPCFQTPIERTILLKSISKTHNKVTSDIIEVGTPSFGNSVILYIDELMPGTYQLELDYGWLNDYTPNSKTSDEELMDFQIEIYSHYQNTASSLMMHNKDRHIKILESAVRDLSVVNFMDRKMGQYFFEDLIIPTHPLERGSPINIPFKIMNEHAQVLIIAQKEFTYIQDIQVLRKDSSSMIKKLDNSTSLKMSEVLPQGEYILRLNYKDNKDREYEPKVQNLVFGISNYDNIKKYKECNAPLITQ